MKKFEAKINNNSIVSALSSDILLRTHIFRIILGGFIFLALVYLFLLGSSVLNIVERKALSEQAHVLSNTIGTLELEYLEASSAIDRDLSIQMGFEEIAQNFATRKSATMISKKLAKNEI